MEADTLAHPVPYRASIAMFLLLLLMGCKNQDGHLVESKQFYPSGKIRELRYFENGKKVGDHKTWWENGQVQSHYIFEDDEYEGTCREWNEHGALIREMNYHKGHESGSQKQWYDDGKVRSNYVIIKGRRYGLLGTKNCVNVSDSPDMR